MNEDLTLRRFWSKVDKRDHGCWVWMGSLVAGYGHFRAGGKVVKAYRFSYELVHGPIPKGLDLRHEVCHNPACVNPEHLVPGTRKQNMIDMVKAGRHKRIIVDSEIRAELTRRSWQNHTSRQRAERLHNMSVALKGKPFTDEHLANLRASPANQKGRPARAFGEGLNASFTAEQVLAIRDKYARGMKQEELAKEYGTGRGAITQIVLGKNYKWVAQGPVKRLAGYGTKKKSEISVHANTGRTITEEQKKRHSEFMRNRGNHA